MVSGKSELPQKGNALQIKQDDKFFCRLLSKEGSMSHPSFRVTAVAVPFVWESQPGTPKYIFSEDTIPPLTPPPSYYFNNNKKPVKKPGSRSNNNNLLALFPKLMSIKKTILSTSHSSSSSSSPSSFSSPSNSFSWSSSDSSSKVVSMGRFGRKRFLSHGSSFDFRGNDEDEGVTSPTSTLCFGIHRSTSSKGNNNGGIFRR